MGLDPGTPQVTRADGTGRGEKLKSTRRVFRMLELIGGREGLTAKLLARELGTSLSTCYHLIGILIEEGYVEKMPRGKGYRLGPTVSVLHRKSFRHDLSSRLEPVLDDLARASMRHAYLGLMEDDTVTVAHVSSPPKRPPVGLVRGSHAASHALALGKVLMAGMGETGIRAYVDNHGLEAFTPRTIIKPDQLEAHLGQVLERGVATDVEEFSEDLCCVAAPVMGSEGKMAGAIGVSTSSRRFDEEVGPLIWLVREAAARASTLLL